MSLPDRLRGVLSPVLTPFNPDLTPSADGLVRHCRALVEQGVGLAVFGTNSEAASMTVAEKRALLDALLAAELPPDRMMPGTGACAIGDAIELTRHAVRAGCAGVLVLPPFYYKGVSDEGLFRAYAQLIEGVADDRLRVYLYHIPPVSGVPITLGLIERLLKAYPGQVAGAKDSSGDWDNTAAMVREFAAGGFDVFPGSEVFLLPGLRAGAVGCITATANVNAGEIMQLYRQWQTPQADALHDRVRRIRGIFQALPMISAMKEAVAWQSGDTAWRAVRPPLVELKESQAAELRRQLTEADYRMPMAETLAYAKG
ncbi:dihydrodipicolinate synthase family protein [Bordetella genomosp. 9]|uniref:Dihydrodipicolinate synthase family protein n=1 Tax=Bordetella genomosp. 9 TaxID=1416803 RepID=A0A1W6YWR5_9BORD|nr:dihydrodipicolinate synthase family protein [Bordetella genomosp. 9]ARP85468.1 dihydrodipicolinate synthase family protein [Bordetella genomosp. 9]